MATTPVAEALKQLPGNEGFNPVVKAMEKLGGGKEAKAAVMQALTDALSGRINIAESQSLDATLALEQLVGGYDKSNKKIEDYLKENQSLFGKLKSEDKDYDLIKGKIRDRRMSTIKSGYLSSKGSFQGDEVKLSTELDKLVNNGVIDSDQRTQLLTQIQGEQSTAAGNIVEGVANNTISEKEALEMAAAYNDNIKKRVEAKLREKAGENDKVKQMADDLTREMQATGPGNKSKVEAKAKVNKMFTDGEISQYEREALLKKIDEEAKETELVNATEVVGTRGGTLLQKLALDIEHTNIPQEVKDSISQELNLYQTQFKNKENMAKIEIEIQEAKQLENRIKQLKVFAKVWGPTALAAVLGGGVGLGIAAIGAGSGLTLLGGIGAAAGGAALAGGATFGVREFLGGGKVARKEAELQELKIKSAINKARIDAEKTALELHRPVAEILAEVLSARYGIDVSKLSDAVMSRLGVTQFEGIQGKIEGLNGLAFSMLESN